MTAAASTALAIMPQTMGELEQLATRLASSSIIPQALRGKASDVLVTIMTGAELGLSPMQSLRSIHVVNGRPVMAAELLVALVKRQPQCRYFRLVESTPERATYETLREGAPEPTRLTYSMDDARRAKLATRETWQAHPAAMLRARCSAALARAEWSDAVLGILEIDEAEEVRVREEAPSRPTAGVLDVQPEPVTDERSTRAVAAVKAAFPEARQLAPQPEDNAARVAMLQLDADTCEEDVATLRSLVADLMGDGDDRKPDRARWYVAEGCGTAKSPMAKFVKMSHVERQLIIAKAREALELRDRTGAYELPGWAGGPPTREPGEEG